MIFRAVEDADLISRARRGDVEAFNLLVSRWDKRVFNYLWRLSGNREDAMDLAQEVFLKAYQSLRKLEDPSRFAPWLYRIAHNEAYSLLRKRRPEMVSEAPELGTQPAYPMELTVAVSTALERLSPEQREAVVLKIYQGLKFEEMAEALDCPVSTVKSRLYAALEQLRDQLAPARERGGGQ